MPAKSVNRYPTHSTARVALALFLTALLVFPDSVALAQTCTNSSWTQSSVKLPQAIETFAAVVNGNHLYVLGGYHAPSGPARQTVSYVKLNTDGSLDATGGFTSQSIPVPLSRDLCGVVSGGYLYAVGGIDYTNGGHGSTTQAVSRAKINTNGSLGPWNTQAMALPVPLQLHGSVALAGYLYVIGGSTYPDDTDPSHSVTNKVYYFQLNGTDGSLGPFMNGPTLVGDTANPSGARYKTCPVVVGNKIYISGGENGGGALQTVYFAQQGAKGVLNGWTRASDLLHLDAAQAVVYNGGIVLMGGDSSGHGTDWTTVYQGAVSNTNPASITWNTLDALTAHVSRNAGATFNTFVYSIGGLVGTNTDTNNINCLKLP